MADEKILMVEGVDDYHVVLHLQSNHGIRVIEKSAIRKLGGIDPLLESLPVQLKASEGGVLGVIVDADQNLSGRWQAIRRCLAEAGYELIPDAPDRQGTILAPPPARLLPKFGAWLMPDNSTGGILEDFLRFLIPADDVLLPYAEATLGRLPDRRFSENDLPKALIHTWLAWQREPGRPFGQAITARFLEPHVAEAVIFVEWLKVLFSD